MGYGVDLLDCDASMYWWADVMLNAVQPAIDKIFSEKDEHDYNGFPYCYLTGRMAIRMLIDNEPYVRATGHVWALDLHDKAIRALTMILNDTRYVDCWEGENKERLVACMRLEVERLTDTRRYLAKRKAEGEAWLADAQARAKERAKEPPEPISPEVQSLLDAMLAPITKVIPIRRGKRPV